MGANGEETLGRRLDGLASPSVQVLHDRRIPRSRANIDHIVLCPAGVLVVDAKQYKGRPHLRVEGGLFAPRTEKLMVGSRDGNKLVDGVLKQVDLVRAAINEESVEVRGYLCFVAADWPLFGGSFATRGVTALWPKRLAGVVAAPGPLTEDAIQRLHSRLAKTFPVA
ncbi:MAG: nuclease-related domain-containing protein [Lapillicoccus sp.]